MNLSRKALVLIGLILVSCKGAQTSVDFAVKVGVDTCKEDRRAEPENEYVTLDCASVSGEGAVRIRFPRRAWWGMVTRDAGVTPSVPGK